MNQSSYEGIALGAADIDRLLRGWTYSDHDLGSWRWQRIRAGVAVRMLWKYFKKRAIHFLGSFSGINAFRTKEFVEIQYNTFWAGDQYPDMTKTAITKKDRMPVEWNGKGFVSNRFSNARLAIEALARVIETTGAKSVLEVGSGNGINLLEVSALVDRVELHGIELTHAGVSAAHKQQEAKSLDPRLLAHLPRPAKFPLNYRKIVFQQGDATALPFPDESFDLVYSITALEQMQSVAPAALREMRRVSKEHLFFIEPFADAQVDQLRKLAIAAKDHLRLDAKGLAQHGIEPEFVWLNWPQKLVGGICMVKARKVPYRAANAQS